MFWDSPLSRVWRRAWQISSNGCVYMYYIGKLRTKNYLSNELNTFYEYYCNVAAVAANKHRTTHTSFILPIWQWVNNLCTSRAHSIITYYTDGHLIHTCIHIMRLIAKIRVLDGWQVEFLIILEKTSVGTERRRRRRVIARGPSYILTRGEAHLSWRELWLLPAI